VGRGTAEVIVEERKTNGPYKNFADFLIRLSGQVLNKKIIEALAQSGALDSLAERNQILTNMDTVLKFISEQKTAANNQMDLFGSSGSKIPEIELKLQAVEPADRRIKLTWEKELLGMYISDHPLKGYENVIREAGTPIGSLDPRIASSEKNTVKIAGLIVNAKKIFTKNKETMIFATLEDLVDKIEVVVFPKILQKNPDIWKADSIIEVTGRLDNRDNALKVVAIQAKKIDLSEIEPVETAEPTELKIYLPNKTTKETLVKIKEILTDYPGELPVILEIKQNGSFSEIKTKTKVSNNRKLAKDLKSLVPEAKINFI